MFVYNDYSYFKDRGIANPLVVRVIFIHRDLGCLYDRFKHNAAEEKSGCRRVDAG